MATFYGLVASAHIGILGYNAMKGDAIGVALNAGFAAFWIFNFIREVSRK